MPGLPGNIPNAPGVPPLPRGSRTPPAAAKPAPAPTQASAPTKPASGRKLWGVVLASTGKDVLGADGYSYYSFSSSAVIAKSPVEGGKFASYNKSDQPFSIKLTALCDGLGDVSRTEFVNRCIALRASRDTYRVFTPHISLLACNCTQFSYEIAVENGVTLIRANLTFEEIRSPTSVKINSAVTTQVPQIAQSNILSGASTKQLGQVTPKQIVDAQLDRYYNKDNKVQFGVKK